MKSKPHFYLFITILVWGSSFPSMSYLLIDLHPMELALSRFLLPGLLGLLYFLNMKLNIPKIDYIRFFFAGFFGIFLYNFFLNTGQTSVSAGASSFIVNCNPLFAFLIGFYILKQKVKIHYWVGITICIIGVFIISLERQLDSIFNKGAFLIFFAAFLTASYFHIIKPLVDKYGVLLSLSLTLVFGTIPMLFWLDSTINSVSILNLKSIFALIWLILFPTLLGYYTWTSSVGYFGPNKASFFLFLIPVFSIIIDYIFLGNLPNLTTLIGGSLIITSVSVILYLNLNNKNI